MSSVQAFRLVLILICSAVITWKVWERADREQLSDPKSVDDSLPRFSAFLAAGSLPFLLLVWIVLGAVMGGWALAIQSVLRLLVEVFLVIGVYYVLLLAVMPVLRRHFSARVCAMLWLLPDFLYLLNNTNQLAAEHPLVIHLPGKLVYVLFAIWAAGAAGVLGWKVLSHLRFRRRVLKDAVPVTDEETLAVWQAELARAWVKKAKWKLVRSQTLTTPLSIGLFDRTTCVVLPARSYTPQELSLVLRHEIIHICRGDPSSKFFMAFCTAMCWFNPLMWVAMRKSADDFELSCDETVLLDEPQPVRREYAELLLSTAGDERGFTTCLSATASALRYRLKNIMTPGKKCTGAILVGLTFAVLALCTGHMALAYDAQPGTARIFDNQPLEDFHLQYLDPWDDPRGANDYACVDEGAFKTYLASLELETYTEKLDVYNDGRGLSMDFNTPKGILVVYLADQSIRVTRIWLENAPTESYYLSCPVDWDYLDTILVPRPTLWVYFDEYGASRRVSAALYSLTQTMADGRTTVLQPPTPDADTEIGRENIAPLRLSFPLPLIEPYTVEIEPLNGGEAQTLTQADLQDDLLTPLPANARYTISATLQGEQDSIYHAVFCFTYKYFDRP